MKILHTSDWHIGKKLMGRDRSEEYRTVLSEICGICETEGVELCLVAGDVFDTYMPSAEAEEIFYAAIKDISRVCAVLIISGNHDDYVRLTAASALAAEQNIYIVGNDLQEIVCGKRGECYPVRSEGGYAVFKNVKGEEVYINTLPYPNEARFKEEKSEESFGEKMTRWVQFGERAKDKKMPSIFLSHIFVSGGKAGDSEREIDLGGARLVPQDTLPKCDYAALGHLHKRQRLGKNIYYSGAPMRFTFEEGTLPKSVNVFNLTADGVSNFKQINLKSIKKLVRLQADSAESGIELLNKYTDDYVELTLTLTEPLNHTQTVELHKCENLLSLKTDVAGGHSDKPAYTRRGKSASELFSDFYQLKFAAQPSDELKELFLSLTEEE